MSDGKIKLAYKTEKGIEYIYVLPIDAKEIVVKGGLYTYAQDIVKQPDEEVVEEKSNEFTTMKSKELDAYVLENGIEIEGFAVMNLVKKRQALIDYISQPQVVESTEVVEEDIGTDDL